ncbi:MAG: SIMPL domain-containing protein [Siphonobacter sp.]
MKTILFITGTLLFSTFTFAQTTEKEPIRKINVTGSSEVQVDPDEFYLTISLKEYYKDEKNQKDKVTIDLLEKELIQSVQVAGFPKDALTIQGISGYQSSLGKKKNPAQFLESKQYQLKLTKLYNVDNLLSNVDSRGIANTYINRVDYSRKEQLKQEVKIKALLDAKAKAKYLVEALGNTLGEVLEIHEIEDGYSAPIMYKAARVNMAAAEVADSDLEYQKIKIAYRIQASFKIK